jgi:AsmA protein
MKLITRLLLGLVAVVATLFIAAAFLVSTIDLAQHKDRIQQFVFDQTGRSLEIRGRVDAQLFPWAGISLQDVTLAGAEGFYTQNFADVEQVEARVRFLPLIVGNVSFKHVHLRGLELDLQRNLEGRTNWDDMMSNTSVVTTDVSSDDVLQEIEAGTPVVAALSVGELVVTDSVVHWRDEMADNRFFLSDFSLSAGEITLSQPFPLETGFTINGVASLPQTQIKASGMAGIDLAENIYRLDSFQVESVLMFADDDIAVVEANVSDDQSADKTEEVISSTKNAQFASRFAGSVVADLNAQRVDFAPWSLDAEGVVLSGELHVTDLFENPAVFGHLSSSDIDAATLLGKQLHVRGVALPASFDASLLQQMALSANFQSVDENFLINDVSIGNAHAELSGNFQIANYLRAPVLTGTITSNRLDLAPWTDAIGYKPPDNTALKRAYVNANVRQSGQLLVLNDIEVTLDESKFTGDVEFVKTDEGQFPIRYRLHTDDFNLDRYLSGKVFLDKAINWVNDPAVTVPVERIRTIDISGEITAAQLQWSGLRFSDVSLPVRIAEGRVEGLEIKATAYKGTLFATTVLDVTPEEPLLTATVSLNAVDIKPVMDVIWQSDTALSGTGIVNIDLLSRGTTAAELASRAGGALNIRITDGAVSRANLANQWVTAISAQLYPQTVNKAEPSGAESIASTQVNDQTTPIDELSMSWELADGNLYSNDLDARSPGMTLSGQGGISLTDRAVDYLLQVNFVESTIDKDDEDFALAADHDRLVGLTLPLAIRKPLHTVASGFIEQLNQALKSELQKPDIFGVEDELDSASPPDIATVKSRLAQHYQAEATALGARLDAIRDAAQQQQNQVPSTQPDDEQEASSSISDEIERKTDALKNRLQNNLQKDPQRKLSTLTEE